jgi:hypothetical protein
VISFFVMIASPVVGLASGTLYNASALAEKLMSAEP